MGSSPDDEVELMSVYEDIDMEMDVGIEKLEYSRKPKAKKKGIAGRRTSVADGGLDGDDDGTCVMSDLCSARSPQFTEVDVDVDAIPELSDDEDGGFCGCWGKKKKSSKGKGKGDGGGAAKSNGKAKEKDSKATDGGKNRGKRSARVHVG
jgi:hypothetical protein